MISDEDMKLYQEIFLDIFYILGSHWESAKMTGYIVQKISEERSNVLQKYNNF